jgi:hypothetical protein
MTIALDLLAAESAPGTEGIEVARKWWHVVDWRIVQGALQGELENGVSVLTTTIIHLLVGLQLDMPNSEQIEKRLREAAEKVVVYYFRGTLEERKRMVTLKRRLDRCCVLWWGEGSRATDKLEELKWGWAFAGVKLWEEVDRTSQRSHPAA